MDTNEPVVFVKCDVSDVIFLGNIGHGSEHVFNADMII